jgi:lysophospholipase L1-like esterase
MSAPRWAVFYTGPLFLLAMSVGVTHAGLRCTVPHELTRFKVNLSHTASAIGSGTALGIVAVGSSSTQGVGASNAAHTYPSLLAAELGHRWPQIAVNVVNKGVGGEMAVQMLARFERDVLPYRPQLVIWQTGSNQALRSTDIEGYVGTLREGIGRLKAAGLDVVLMDPQFAPRLLARPIHPLIVASINAVASDMKVAVFQRFAVMRHWILSAQYSMGDVISSDGLHMNDTSYSCIARLLADSIAEAVDHGPSRAVAEPAGTRSEEKTDRTVWVGGG